MLVGLTGNAEGHRPFLGLLVLGNRPFSTGGQGLCTSQRIGSQCADQFGQNPNRDPLWKQAILGCSFAGSLLPMFGMHQVELSVNDGGLKLSCVVSARLSDHTTPKR